MEKNKNTQEAANTNSKQPGEDKRNPFKETSVPEPAETPEEEAEAEQQRKEALTERD